MHDDPDQDPNEFRGEYLSDDEAGNRYEAEPDFVNDAIDALCGTNPAALPEPLRQALTVWYRTTSRYEEAVLDVRDKAERCY